MIVQSQPVTLDEIQQLVARFQEGRLFETQALARELIKRVPHHGFFWKILGVSLQQSGAYEESLQALQQAAALLPNDAEAQENLGNGLQFLGKIDEAICCLEHAIQLNPESHSALNNLGSLLQKKNNVEQAELMFRRALLKHPQFYFALINLGTILEIKRSWYEAEKCFREALHVDPQSIEAWVKLSGVLIQQKRLTEANEIALHVVQIHPNNARSHYQCAETFKALEQYQAAEQHYQRAIALDPNCVEALINLGNILRECKRLHESEAVLHQALQQPHHRVEAFISLALTLKEQGHYGDGEEACRRALKIEPNRLEGLRALGCLLHKQGHLEEAELHQRHALVLDPENVNVHIELALTLLDQGRLTEALAIYDDMAEVDPSLNVDDARLFMLNYHPHMTSAEIYAEYRKFDQHVGMPCRQFWPRHHNQPIGQRRLKVAYLSPNFCKHAVHLFLAPLIEHHDRSKLELYAYAEVKFEDDVTQQYKNGFDHWLSTLDLTDQEIAEHMIQNEIDVVVDLAGHTAGNRLGVMARKPAPVSVAWLGYGYTTGLSAIDYLLTDDASCPKGGEDYLSEQPWHLPVTNYIYRAAPHMGPVGTLPAEQNGFITFGSLSRALRLNDDVIDTWSSILHQVPSSRLVIDSSNFADASMQQRYLERFAKRGIDPSRLTIGFHTPPWDVLRSIDIGLDCFPHNSGTTLVEMLYMGIPFITLQGRPTMGRIGSSILYGAVHPEWIAQSHEQYIAMTIELAANVPRLAQIRNQLRAELQASPLMDEAGFAGKVEEAYFSMFKLWCEDQS